MGFGFHQAGRFAEAERCYRQVLQAAPEQPDALHLLGLLARRAGALGDAETLIRRAVAHAPNNPDFQSNLGMVLTEAGTLEEAITAFRLAIKLRPDFVQAHCNLGAALMQLRQWQPAVDAFETAIRLKPDLVEAHSNLANALLELPDVERAISTARLAVEMSPLSADIHYNLGYALQRAGRLDDAADAFIRALELNPKQFMAGFHLANVAPRRALELHERAIARNPNDAEAHWCLAVVCLQQGDFKRGWSEYEWRMRCDTIARPLDLPQQRWQGEPLNGRTILVHLEQGFGDTLQFLRYIPMVAQRGGRVIMLGVPELQRLMETVPGTEFVVPRKNPVPPFELHCPLMSLPFVFGTTLDSIPATVPYLVTPESVKTAWARKLTPRDGRKRVGLVWAGRETHKNDFERSMPLAILEPLAKAGNAEFFSLQKGTPTGQIRTAAFGRWLVDHTADLHDFADTAGLIESLDLVITVDTAVAHLAGGLGKPVWLLLPRFAEWRWLTDREDSPWYPTMRIFRQPEPRNWAVVVQRIAGDLARIE